MKRIVLLTEHQPDFQTRRCIDQLCSGLGADFDFSLQSLGRTPLDLARILAIRRAARQGSLIHAWGYRALRTAAFAGDCPIAFTPSPDDPPRMLRWLRSMGARRQVRMIALAGAEDRHAAKRGILPEDRTVVLPGVRPARELSRDQALREELGFSAEHKLVLAAGESCEHSNHLLALHAAAILNSINPEYRLVIWGRGPGVEAVEALQHHWRSDLLCNAERKLRRPVEYEALVRCADLALVTSSDRVALWPILACMAGGLPIVAPATHAISDVLEDRHTAMLYSPVRARKAAQRTLLLAEDAALARRLADQAHAEAYELFAVSRFLDQMRGEYLALTADKR